jgi:transcriptional regulator with PAS, ATPase and Fis domain
LNDELREVFRKWYPHFTQGDENQRKAAQFTRFLHSQSTPLPVSNHSQYIRICLVISETLEQKKGNKSEAAKVLNITRTTLNSKLKKYNLSD